MDEQLKAFGLLAMPTTSIVAPTIAEVADPNVFAARNAAVLRNTSIINFFDLCAISLPLPDTQLPVIHAYLNPLVKWIWLGGAVVVLGTLVALLPNRRAVLVLAGAHEPSTATQSLQPGLTPSVIRREGHD